MRYMKPERLAEIRAALAETPAPEWEPADRAIAELLEHVDALADDLDTTTERMKNALDDCRCPECQCADQIDAESQECGCDGAVCSRGGGETLAAWGLRMMRERDAAREGGRPC